MTVQRADLPAAPEMPDITAMSDTECRETLTAFVKLVLSTRETVAGLKCETSEEHSAVGAVVGTIDGLIQAVFGGGQ